jgi:glycosyltransferase involved in cell wall biosynthesis
MDPYRHRIAIVADWLTSRGGAERVLFGLTALFPDAAVFTSVVRPELYPELAGRDVRTTWLQHLPEPLRRRHQYLLPLLPGAFARLDLSGFDLVISSSAGFSKSVRTPPGAVHVCYCHTPVRFLPHARAAYIRDYPLPLPFRPARLLLPPLLGHMARIDRAAAGRVDHFVANSRHVAARIHRFYGRDATVVHPGVDQTRFRAVAPAVSRDYFLAVGRFIPYKRFDLLVETFNRNGLPLVLAGDGPDLARLRNLAMSNIRFSGFVADADLPALYAGARAFLMPAEEDFGLTPVEAMASGTPVIAYAGGGAAETVDSSSVLFFDTQSPESLQGAINALIAREPGFDPDAVRARAADFDMAAFQRRMLAFLDGL